jgi:hypothetical protein
MGPKKNTVLHKQMLLDICQLHLDHYDNEDDTLGKLMLIGFWDSKVLVGHCREGQNNKQCLLQ